jgi:flagellar L-ring protein precursor FlgH
MTIYKFSFKNVRVLLSVLAVLSLSGCVDYFESNSHVEYPPAYPRDYAPPQKTNGSIYQSGYDISLYQDRVAYHVGDVLTIRLEEQTQGQKRARTRADKKASNKFAINEAFGANLSNGTALDTSSDMKFDGNGESNQNNQLTGTISVTVTRVLSNGSLVVQGESWVTINFGREYIQLSGIVRRDDIDPDNTVSSQRVANARITYSGNGQVANTSRGGILTQFFYKFWPY